MHALLDGFALKPERESNAAAVKAGNAGSRVDAEAQDLLGGFGGHGFNIHPAFGGAHKGNAGRDAVYQQRKVKLGGDAGTVFYIYTVHNLARRAGLVGNQRAPEHLLRFFRSFGYRLGDSHTASLAGFRLNKMALAAPACVDLCFYNPDRAVQLTCSGFGIFGPQHCAAIRDRRAIFAQKLFGLILVDIHSHVPFCSNFRFVRPKR